MVSPSSEHDIVSQSPQSPLSVGPEGRPGRGVFLFLWVWFWRVTLVVSLAAAWYCYYVPSNSIAWADDYASARQQAARSGEPIILFFTGKWCVPCRIMKRNVWADEQVRDRVNAAFVPVMIDVDDPEAAEALGLYQVGITPTTIIADPQGDVLVQARGGMGKPGFLALLATAEGQANQ